MLIFLQPFCSENPLVARYQHQSIPTVLYTSLPDPHRVFSSVQLDTFIINTHPRAAILAFHIKSNLQGPSALLSRDRLKPEKKTVASNHKNNIVSLLTARTSTSFRQKQIYRKTEAVQAPWGLCGDMLFVTWTNWLTPHPMCSSTLAVVLKLWENGSLVTFFAERWNK